MAIIRDVLGASTGLSFSPVVAGFVLGAGFFTDAPDREGLEAFAMADSFKKVRGTRCQSRLQSAAERENLPPFWYATGENLMTFVFRASTF